MDSTPLFRTYSVYAPLHGESWNQAPIYKRVIRHIDVSILPGIHLGGEKHVDQIPCRAGIKPTTFVRTLGKCTGDTGLNLILTNLTSIKFPPTKPCYISHHFFSCIKEFEFKLPFSLRATGKPWSLQ